MTDPKTDPSTKFGELAMQVPVTLDERPSIAELQRISVPGFGWQNQAVIAIGHVAPVLLEMAAAALRRQRALVAINSGSNDTWDSALAKVRT